MHRIWFKKSCLALAILPAFAEMARADNLFDMDLLRADYSNPEIQATEGLIDQTGSGNFATINQGTSSGDPGHGQYAEINQDGSSNQANITQSVDSNRARIDQTGSANLANATQNGSGNSLDIVQNGSSNSVDLTQTGDGNLFNSSQIGNNNSIVASQIGLSTTTLSEVGNNNSISVNLDSPGLYVNISIVGDGMFVSRTH